MTELRFVQNIFAGEISSRDPSEGSQGSQNVSGLKVNSCSNYKIYLIHLPIRH